MTLPLSVLLATQRSSRPKSVGKTTNPIADRSPELWKTLANWVRAVKNGTVDASRTHFEIFVSRRRRGALAESFDQAQTPAEASAALSAAKAVLTPVGKSGKRRKLHRSDLTVQYVPQQQVQLLKSCRGLRWFLASVNLLPHSETRCARS